MTQDAERKYEMGQRHVATVMLVLLVILGSIERIYGIDRQSLWSDELYAVIASYKTQYADVWKLMLGDSHPPGYLSFMYWTLPLTGYSDFGIRLHALVFGIAWIPLVFWLGRRWFSVNTGLLAATVIASAYNAVYYSQEARAYTMLVAFNLLNLICFFEILFGEKILVSEKRQRRYVVGFIVANVAMLYLHYTGFVFLSAEILLYGLLWIMQKRRGSIREALILFGIPLLLYAPWLGEMYANLTDAPRDWSVSKAPTLAETYNTLQRLLGPDDSHMEFHVTVIALAILCTVVDHVKQGVSSRLAVKYCLIFLMVVPILAFYIESLIATPIFEKRYFLSAMAIEAILVGCVLHQLISLASRKWTNMVVVIAIVFYSIWTINSNIAARLYTLQDKDPVREAVAIVRNDIGKNSLGSNYTVLMTHDWFEHYLKRAGVSYDPDWEYRHFYVPQQVSAVLDYLAARPEIEYFYYLSLREPNAQAALFAIKHEYKLLSKTEVAIEQGTIDVFKFSAKDLADDGQLNETGSNPSNEIAKIVALDAKDKNPASYRILYTHDWVLPYLRRNGVKVDHESGTGSYVINAQADAIFSFVQQHPEVDTLYYLALQEPNAEGAMFMLQSRYLLANEKTVETSVGSMNILKFDVKGVPVDAPSLRLRRERSKVNDIAELLAKQVDQSSPETYVVAMTHSWFEPYIEQNGVHFDKNWSGHILYLAAEEERLSLYLKAHPGIKHFYYVALLEPGLQPLLDILKKQMSLQCEKTIAVAAGSVSLMQFDVSAPPNGADITVPDCGD